MFAAGHEGIETDEVAEAETGVRQDRRDGLETKGGLRLGPKGTTPSAPIPSWPEQNTRSVPAGTNTP